ncbi:hypothetical protein ABPG75_000699 [Micractinium tetrahymenae]
MSRVVAGANCPSMAACFVGRTGRTLSENVAAQFGGELWVPDDGVYTFYLSSNDNSRLRLGSNAPWTIDQNDCEGGWAHGCVGQPKSTTLWLAGGRWHPLTLEFYQGSGEGGVVLSWSGPGIEQVPIPATDLRTLADGILTAGCPASGNITLALIGSTDLGGAYSTCFTRFAVQLDAACQLWVVPAAGAAKWSYSALWALVAVQDTNQKACPTSSMSGGKLADVSAASLAAGIQAALQSALFANASTITSAVLGADSLTLATRAPANATLRYAVVSGSIGTSVAAGASACASGDCAYSAASGCPAGRYNITVGASAVCAYCQPGSSCAGGKAQPVDCVAGKAASAGSKACTPCPPGSFSSLAGQSACTLCPPDQFAVASGRTSCSYCPGDSHSHFPGSAVCLSCYFGQPVVASPDASGVLPPLTFEMPAPGTLIATTSADSQLANVTACGFSPLTAACSSMRSRLVAIDSAADCAVTIYALGDDKCSQADNLTLVRGFWADESTIYAALPDSPATSLGIKLQRSGGSLSLSFFQLTTAFDRADLAVCNDSLALLPPDGTAGICPAGTALEENPQVEDFVDVFRPSQCAPCQAGSQCQNGAAALCAPESFTTLLGSPRCQVCPTRWPSLHSSPRAVQCGEGCIPEVVRANCASACPAGWYREASTSRTCRICPAGKYRPAFGYVAQPDACLDCPPGMYSAEGAAQCTPCPPGTAQLAGSSPPFPATGNCPLCPAGEYTDVPGAQRCNICPANSYSATPGSTSCTQCGAGEVTISKWEQGATQCTPCPTGTWAGPEDTRCNRCIADFETRVNGTGASSCTPCQPGSYAYNSSHTGPFSVGPVGYFAFEEGSSECEECEAGTFNNATGQANCTECPAGTFNPYTGSSRADACRPCQPGMFASGSGSTFCDVCEAGTYQDLEGQSSCKVGSK